MSHSLLGKDSFDIQPFKDGISRYIVFYYFSHNSSVDRDREVFKPSTDSARLLVSTEKNFSVLGLGFPKRDVTSSFFAFLRPTLASRRRQSNKPIFWRKVSLEIRLSSESLKPLIGFLAYVEPKLWPEKQKLVKISTPTNANLVHYTHIIAGFSLLQGRETQKWVTFSEKLRQSVLTTCEWRAMLTNEGPGTTWPHWWQPVLWISDPQQL